MLCESGRESMTRIRRSAPTMSAACCARRNCCRRGPSMQAGRLSAEELRRVEDAAIRDAVRMQEEIGLQGVTDGEFRRGSWHMDFLYQIGGVAKTDQTLHIQFRNEAGPVEAALGALSHRRQADPRQDDLRRGFRLSEIGRARRNGAETDDPVALDAALPRRPGGDRPGRLSRHGGVLARPRRGLHARRSPASRRSAAPICSSTTPASPISTTRRSAPMSTASAATASTQHLTNIRLINQALAGKPAGMTVCTHMCRGNFRSSWVAEGGYDHVAEALFGELAVDGFFLEYDDARSGGFEPLRFVPQGRQAGRAGPRHQQAGGARKQGRAEAPHRRGRQIRAARAALPQPAMRLLIDRRRQCADPIDEQIAKLRLVVETAREVWG